MEKSSHDILLSVLQVTFGLSLCIIIVLSILIGAGPSLVSNATEETKLFHLKKPKFKGNIFPVPHVALLYQDGSIYDLSLHEDLSPSRGFLFKLPKDEGYFGYSDPEGVLYLISATIYRKITKYHRHFNHRTIKNSGASFVDYDYGTITIDLSSQYFFGQGVQIGRKFWVMKKLHKSQWSSSLGWEGAGQSCDLTENSFLWDMIDKRWDTASSVGLKNNQHCHCQNGWCLPSGLAKGVVAINASAILFVYDPEYENDMYDIEKNEIVKYPAMMDQNQSIWWNQYYNEIYQSSLATLVTKHQRKVFAELVWVRIVNSHITGWQARLLSYNLDEGAHGAWILEADRIDADLSEYGPRSSIKAINGQLYSFNNMNATKGFISIFENGQWDPWKKPNIERTDPIVTVIPYLIRNDMSENLLKRMKSM